MPCRSLLALLVIAVSPMGLAPWACGVQRGSAARTSDSSRTASASASANAPAPATGSAASRDAGGLLAFEADRGCAQEFEVSGEPVAVLKALGALCAPGMGQVLVSDALQATSEQPASVTLPVTRASCLRLGAVSDPPGLAVQLQVTGPRLQAKEASRIPMLLGRDGPVCVGEAGDFMVQARPLAEAARVWVAAWALPPPSAIPAR